MDHVKLEPVSFPDGMAVPRVMQYQDFPWNGDGYLAAEVFRLRDTHELKAAAETGTCLGVTTSWLCANFKEVSTCELHKPFLDIARALLSGRDNVIFRGGHSPGFITDAVQWHGVGGAILFFLDAHGISGSGTEACPLLDELSAIASTKAKPCIIIHDFQVPGKDFGFDKMPDGRPFNLDLIHEHLNAIYGEGGWECSYPANVEGARRGWISIEPVRP